MELCCHIRSLIFTGLDIPYLLTGLLTLFGCADLVLNLVTTGCAVSVGELEKVCLALVCLFCAVIGVRFAAQVFGNGQAHLVCFIHSKLGLVVTHAVVTHA